MYVCVYIIYVLSYRTYVGLTDKVLESVVAKGSGELLSLDLSAVPHLLTDHALSVIGQYVSIATCNAISLVVNNIQAYAYMYVCT